VNLCLGPNSISIKRAAPVSTPITVDWTNSFPQVRSMLPYGVTPSPLCVSVHAVHHRLCYPKPEGLREVPRTHTITLARRQSKLAVL